MEMEAQTKEFRVIVEECSTGEPFIIEQYDDSATATTVARNLRRYYVTSREDGEFNVRLQRMSNDSSE